jgi:hypothetical protein
MVWPAAPELFLPATETAPPPKVVMLTIGKLLAPNESRLLLVLPHTVSMQPLAVKLSALCKLPATLTNADGPVVVKLAAPGVSCELENLYWPRRPVSLSVVVVTCL